MDENINAGFNCCYLSRSKQCGTLLWLFSFAFLRLRGTCNLVCGDWDIQVIKHDGDGASHEIHQTPISFRLPFTSMLQCNNNLANSNSQYAEL